MLHVHPGQRARFKATEWNKIVDKVNEAPKAPNTGDRQRTDTITLLNTSKKTLHKNDLYYASRRIYRDRTSARPPYHTVVMPEGNYSSQIMHDHLMVVPTMPIYPGTAGRALIDGLAHVRAWFSPSEDEDPRAIVFTNCYIQPWRDGLTSYNYPTIKDIPLVTLTPTACRIIGKRPSAEMISIGENLFSMIFTVQLNNHRPEKQHVAIKIANSRAFNENSDNYHGAYPVQIFEEGFDRSSTGQGVAYLPESIYGGTFYPEQEIYAIREFVHAIPGTENDDGEDEEDEA